MTEKASTQDSKKKFVEENKYTSIGLALGSAFGVALGAAFGYVGMGIAMGTIIGIIIGAQIDQRKREGSKDAE